MTNLIDLHAYWDPGHLSLEQLIERMRQHGITQAILSPPCTQGREPDKSELMYRVQRELLRTRALRPLAQLAAGTFYNRDGQLHALWRLWTKDSQPLHKILEPKNEALRHALEPFGEELRAWCWINPARRPSLDQVRDELRHPRVVGLKLHAYWHRFTLEQTRPLFALARETGCPVYWILGFGWLRDALALAREFPEVPVVFGYGGFPYFGELWAAIRPMAQLHVDFASNHLDGRGIAGALRALGAERCFYGSDCPYNFKGEDGTFDYRRTIERVERLVSGPSRTAVFAENARRLVTHRIRGGHDVVSASLEHG